MVWDPLFDTTRCPVEHVDKMDMQFISDCMVRPAPDPIFDCPEILLPPDPPPPPIPPCPTISCGQGSSPQSASATIAIKMLCPDQSATADVTVLFDCGTAAIESDTSTGGCDVVLDVMFNFDFRLGIPMPPCPVIAASATVNSGSSAAPCGGDPKVNLVVTTTGGSCSGSSMSACEFLFEFDFTIPKPIVPCPSIDGAANITVGQGSATADLAVTPTTSGTACDPICNYDFDLDVHIPCATIRAASPKATVTVTEDHTPSDCAFDFDFDFPCPTIVGDATAEMVIGAPAADLTLTTSHTSSTCNFNFDFDFQIPCPTIEATGSVTVGNGSSAGVDVTITPTSTASSCNFVFDFDFQIPCPTITGNAQAQNAIVDLDVIPQDACGFLFDFDFWFPPPREIWLQIGQIITTTLPCSESAAVTASLSEGSSLPSAQIYILSFNFEIPRGCDGSAGPSGPPGSDGDKYAIVPADIAIPGNDAGYVGLICVEGPEVRFEDVMRIELPEPPGGRIPIDPLFFSVCEPDSIEVVGLVPSLPVVAGARVSNREIILSRETYTNQPVSATIKLSGIRLGRKDVRFPRFTEDQYQRNKRFWSGWNI